MSAANHPTVTPKPQNSTVVYELKSYMDSYNPVSIGLYESRSSAVLARYEEASADSLREISDLKIRERTVNE